MPGSSHDSQNQFDVLSQHQAVPTLDAWAVSVLKRDGQVPARHHRFLLEQLDRVSRGERDRLMVLMPPGSAKSTYGSAYNVVAGAYPPAYTMAPGHGLYT